MIVFLAWFGIALAPPADGPPGAEAARDYFARLYEDRAAIKSGILVYTLEIEKDDKAPDLNGSVTTYRLWFDGERRRFDVDEARPRDPEEANHSRYAYSDGAHRLIDDDRPDMAVREYTNQFLAGAPAPGGPIEVGNLVDPRLFGVVGIDFGLLQHSQLEEIKTFAPGTTLRVSPASASGREPAEFEIAKPSGSRRIYITSGKSLLPSRMVTWFAPKDPQGRPIPDIRVEVDCEVETFTNRLGAKFDFPRTLRVRRIVEGEIKDAHKVATVSAEFNVPIDPELMTWKALRPQKGATLMYNGEYKSNRYASLDWDGEKFRKIVNSPRLPQIDEHDPEPRSEGTSRLRMWSYASALLAAVLGTFVLWNKFRPRNASTRSG